MTKLSVQKPSNPTKVTPKLFAWVKKIKAKNPGITSEGLSKMVQNQVGRSTIDLILKCEDYRSYVWMLGKLADIERLKRLIVAPSVVVTVDHQLAVHRWKSVFVAACIVALILAFILGVIC